MDISCSVDKVLKSVSCGAGKIQGFDVEFQITDKTGANFATLSFVDDDEKGEIKIYLFLNIDLSGATGAGNDNLAKEINKTHFIGYVNSPKRNGPGLENLIYAASFVDKEMVDKLAQVNYLKEIIALNFLGADVYFEVKEPSKAMLEFDDYTSDFCPKLR